MQIQIKATDLELTPSIEDYAKKRVGQLDKFFQQRPGQQVLTTIEVAKTTRHHKHGDVFRAEVSVRADGKHYYAAAEKDDLYAAIDEVKDEVGREIVSSKEKRETLLRRGGAKIKSFIKKLGLKD